MADMVDVLSELISPDADLGFLNPLIDLLKEDVVREKLQETARIYYSNSFITFNLIPWIILAAIIYRLWLMMSEEGYGGSSSGYGAPEAGYGAPEAGYGAPAPAAGYGSRKSDAIASLQAQVAALQESYGFGGDQGNYGAYDTQNPDVAAAYGS